MKKLSFLGIFLTFAHASVCINYNFLPYLKQNKLATAAVTSLTTTALSAAYGYSQNPAFFSNIAQLATNTAYSTYNLLKTTGSLPQATSYVWNTIAQHPTETVLGLSGLAFAGSAVGFVIQKYRNTSSKNNVNLMDPATNHEISNRRNNLMHSVLKNAVNVNIIHQNDKLYYKKLQKLKENNSYIFDIFNFLHSKQSEKTQFWTTSPNIDEEYVLSLPNKDFDYIIIDHNKLKYPIAQIISPFRRCVIYIDSSMNDQSIQTFLSSYINFENENPNHAKIAIIVDKKILTKIKATIITTTNGLIESWKNESFIIFDVSQENDMLKRRSMIDAYVQLPSSKKLNIIRPQADKEYLTRAQKCVKKNSAVFQHKKFLTNEEDLNATQFWYNNPTNSEYAVLGTRNPKFQSIHLKEQNFNSLTIDKPTIIRISRDSTKNHTEKFLRDYFAYEANNPKHPKVLIILDQEHKNFVETLKSLKYEDTAIDHTITFYQQIDGKGWFNSDSITQTTSSKPKIVFYNNDLEYQQKMHNLEANNNNKDYVIVKIDNMQSIEENLKKSQCIVFDCKDATEKEIRDGVDKILASKDRSVSTQILAPKSMEYYLDPKLLKIYNDYPYNEDKFLLVKLLQKAPINKVTSIPCTNEQGKIVASMLARKIYDQAFYIKADTNFDIKVPQETIIVDAFNIPDDQIEELHKKYIQQAEELKKRIIIVSSTSVIDKTIPLFSESTDTTEKAATQFKKSQPKQTNQAPKQKSLLIRKNKNAMKFNREKIKNRLLTIHATEQLNSKKHCNTIETLVFVTNEDLAKYKQEKFIPIQNKDTTMKTYSDSKIITIKAQESQGKSITSKNEVDATITTVHQTLKDTAHESENPILIDISLLSDNQKISLKNDIKNKTYPNLIVFLDVKPKV